jgi:hypothetical protein
MQFSPRAQVFFGGVIAGGSVIALQSAYRLLTGPVSAQWLALAALTLLTGSFTIRVTRLSVSISVSDAFVFAAVLLFGPEPATVIVAIDSVVATLWMRQYRSPFQAAFNLSVASLSIWSAATAFYGLAGPLPPNGGLSLTWWPLLNAAALAAVRLGEFLFPS